MFFRKKNPEENSFASKSLRRRFHHLLIEKRKGGLPKYVLPRPRKTLRPAAASPSAILLKKISYFLFTLGIFVGIVYLAFFSAFFSVDKIALEKNGNAVAGSSLAPFLDKLKGKNLLFINTDSLSREIEQTFRNEILLVNIEKSYPQKIIVKVEEYPAILNLYVVTPDKAQKFVLNQIGYSIFENTEQKGLPTLTWRTDKEIPKKSVIIAKEKFGPIAESFEKFKTIFGMKTPQGEWFKRERELHLKTEKNFFVWLDLTANIDQQIMKLKRSLPKLDIYHEPLEYIDLRISGGDSEKVIYKRRK